MQAAQISMVENLIQLIEENIRENPDLDRLAEKSGFSKAYIHRLFGAMTGQPLMAYVRNRRLTLSLNELLKTDKNIVDIALEYGFGYEQSYIRAFKQMFQMTPAHCRKMHCELPVVERIDTAHWYEVNQGLVLTPRLSMLPEFYLAGIEQEIIHDHNFYHQDTNRMVKELEQIYLPKIENKVSESVYYGLVQYHGKPGGRLYAACVEVDRPGKDEAPVKNYTIPMNNYAVFKYVGMHSPYEITFRLVLSLYEKINEWKEETSYIQAAPFHIEHVDLKKCGQDYCEMDIYVPVCSEPQIK